MTDFGRRPVCPECPEVIPNMLPKTGQETEYYEGDDGTYQAGWEGERFTDNEDGTITDNATNLMWVKDLNDPLIDMASRNWDAQIDHIEALEYAGHSDWRMPNIIELLSLIDWTWQWGRIFTDFSYPEDYFWASTKVSHFEDNSYWVDPSNGIWIDSAGWGGTYSSFIVRDV